MLALVVVAAAVGIGNFAAALGMGMSSGANARSRLEVGIVFGVFEGGMPVLGLLLGHGVARNLGTAAKPVGGILLGVLGCVAIVRELLARRRSAPRVVASDESGRRVLRLLLTGAVLALDNLVVGFALGTYHVSLAVAAILIGAVSVVLSLLGLEIGGRLGTRLGPYGDLVGGVLLVAVGIGIGTGVL